MGVESARHDAIFQNNWGLQPNWCYAYKIDCQFIVDSSDLDDGSDP